MGYSTPRSGKEYVILNVTIKNLGKDEVSYNPFDFKVQDANGAQEGTTYVSLDDNLSSGTLAPGGKVTGSMAFEVPIGDQAKLIFQPSFWDSQRVVVDLGNK
jgi:archaellum component FlaG (FlaF/FlaG flagellin family)